MGRETTEPAPMDHHVRHNNRGSTDPAIRAYCDRDENASVGAGDPAGLIAHMLMAAAENLDAGGDLGARAGSRSFPKCNKNRYRREVPVWLGVGKKGAELDPAGERAFSKVSR